MSRCGVGCETGLRLSENRGFPDTPSPQVQLDALRETILIWSTQRLRSKRSMHLLLDSGPDSRIYPISAPTARARRSLLGVRARRR